MKKRIAALLLCLAALGIFPGCASILNGSVTYVTPHEQTASSSPQSVIVANTYEELKARALDFVKQHAETGSIQVNSYSGDDLQADIDRICGEIIKNDPLGAYAVDGMTGSARQIFTHFDIVFRIDYRKNVTEKQMNDIISVWTLRSLRSDLQSKLSDYATSLTVLSKGTDLATRDDAQELVRQIYYENPMDIVMLPVISVEFYPDQATDKIIEFTFGYRYASSILTAMEEALQNNVKQFAVEVTGDDDGAILLSLAQRVMDVTEYDKTADSSGDDIDQNVSATAYGALVTGKAASEGYAMAYKALCDELGLESYVVIGTLNGQSHAWNIVALEDSYYHIDVSMCDVNGISTAFLKSDTEMKKNYSWDTSKYKACNGPLTYNSLSGSITGGPTGNHAT
ncbi:hypothetical protein SAMN02745823_02138 [Sporobacter termitidis DSM 10068]|uniref:Transglutaminase-like domain-containing protein n=1 Tax=Sporobacter termitidis DSM 10068 TaxID=1123282 RepID=A0A1M5Y1H9_9FIRM|nr:transglutaminase domain-containing protein [Sporobacter termitidis]SHI05799.1 hypothetical protein SAMN02745823_02138 [Sporobacter termitidis DSM 10068]